MVSLADRIIDLYERNARNYVSDRRGVGWDESGWLGSLAIVSILTVLPGLMVFLSIVLPPLVNRWLNFAMGLFYTLTEARPPSTFGAENLSELSGPPLGTMCAFLIRSDDGEEDA